jgi:predicted N-formylglutamate amidohydrolase
MDSAFRILRPEGKGRFVILCDHASNHIPEELDHLGLPAPELHRHIAFDIGAAGVTEELSNIFDSPAILCGASRLVIDCNRQLHAPDLIPEVSDGTRIEGNRSLSAAARQTRIERWFEPYHAAIESVIDGRGDPIVMSIHSMTARLAGVARPWQIALSSQVERGLTDAVLSALRNPGDITVGDNQPYDLDPTVDYSIPFHALRRRLRYLQVEFRQDEVAEVQGQIRWARRFADALSRI